MFKRALAMLTLTVLVGSLSAMPAVAGGWATVRPATQMSTLGLSGDEIEALIAFLNAER